MTAAAAGGAPAGAHAPARAGTLTVAPLTAGSVAQYRALMLHAYEHAPDAFTSTAEERAAEPDAWWVKRIADPAGNGVAFGAFDGDALVGTVAVEFAAKPKTQHRALLIGMYVYPHARGRGAGRALVDAAIACCRARRGITVMHLTVTHGNVPATQLYRNAGFQDFGVEPKAMRTAAGYLSKLHMWLDLEPSA